MSHSHGPRDFADAEVEKDVHLMILDHLAYQATQALLDDLGAHHDSNGDQARDHLLENHLELFHSYFMLSSPELRHSFNTTATSSPSIPGSIVLRVQLLQFVTSYHTNRNPSYGPSRFTQQSLKLLRRNNNARALRWTEHRKDSTAEDRDAIVSLLQQSNMQENIAEGSQWQTCPRLLDLIPAFVKLTAARMKLSIRDGQQDSDAASQAETEDNGEPNEWQICEAWLYLAAELMLQAALEDQGSTSARTSFLAFCWGSLASTGTETVQGNATSSDLFALNSVFDTRRPRSRASSHGSDMDVDSPDWEAIRETYQEYARKLRTQANDPATHDLRNAHSAAQFHEKLIGYLTALASSIAPPLLSQLDEDSDEDIVLEEIELTSEESRRLRAIARGVAR